VIRDSGLLNKLNSLGWKINDCEKLQFEYSEPDPPSAGVRNPRSVGSATKKIYEKVYDSASKGQLCLTLGGDHSLAIGSIAATCRSRPDTVVFWIDAHGDINTPETSPTGNIHGMPVAFLMGMVKDVPGFDWLRPCLTSDRIVFIGLRDVDPGEKKILKEHKIQAYSMTDVDKHGIAKIMEMSLDAVNPKRDKPIHLSFDVDAIDPRAVPSTGTTVDGGLTYREARYICTALAETGLLVAIDIPEVNPSIGNQTDVQNTAAVAVSIAQCALGETLL
jgi:arginase